MNKLIAILFLVLTFNFTQGQSNSDCKLNTVFYEGTEITNPTSMYGPVKFTRTKSPLGNIKYLIRLELKSREFTSKYDLTNVVKIYFDDGTIMEFEKEITVSVGNTDYESWQYGALFNITPKLKSKLLRNELKGFSLNGYEKATNDSHTYIDKLKCLYEL